MSNYEIIRNDYLAEKIVIVDGLPGCGKTMISPIVAAFDRVELLNYAFEIEFICRLKKLKKISDDATISLIRMLTDHKLYQTMMGRETNFRYSDLSSVFNDSEPLKYFKRIFSEGDLAIPDKIKREKPILNLTTHDLFSYSKPLIQALENRLVFIEVIRHPLYMIIQQTLNLERLLNNPRDIQINFEYKNNQIPYFAKGWEELFLKSNNVEKAIYLNYECIKMNKLTKNEIVSSNFSNNFITIPFESFVLNPDSYMKKIEKLLESAIINKTIKALKKQKVPRKKIADSLPLAVYKRCGWVPPKKNLNERDELNIRRDFCINQGAGKLAMEKLDEISLQYEKKYCQDMFLF